MKAAISKHFTFDSAHRLQNHDGKCRRLHGHTYSVDVSIFGDIINGRGSPKHGMVMDFGDLKAVVKPLIDAFDHHTILETGDPLIDVLPKVHVVTMAEAPTAEHMAAYFTGRIVSSVGPDYDVTVTVAETPTSTATFSSLR